MKNNDKLIDFLSEAVLESHIEEDGWIATEGQLTTIFLKGGETLLISADIEDFEIAISHALEFNRFIDMSTWRSAKRSLEPYVGKKGTVYSVLELHYEVSNKRSIDYLDPREIKYFAEGDAALRLLVKD